MQGMTPLTFTTHAREQMRKRGIDEDTVRFIHDTPADRVQVCEENCTLNLFTMVRGVPIRVTLDPFQEIPLIITVAIASEKQLAA